MLQIRLIDRPGMWVYLPLMTAFVGYITACVNPFIYALRYEVFRRHLKQMLCKSTVTPGNAG